MSIATSVYSQWEWVHNSEGSSNFARVEDLAVDNTNDVMYSVGFLTGNPNFPEISNGELHGGQDGFVIKYDLLGNVLWAFPIGGDGNDRIHGVAVDESTGDIFVTGFIQGSWSSNNTTLYGEIAGTSSAQVTGTQGGLDAFVASYSSAGELLWYRVIGGTGYDGGFDVAVNSSGVFVNGIYTNTSLLNLYPFIITLGDVINNFVVALDKSDGSTMWDAVLGSGIDDYDVPLNSEIRRMGITADDNGIFVNTFFHGSSFNVYNASNTLDTTIVDPNASSEDYVVTSYTNNGAHNWSVLYDNDGSVVGSLDITNDCEGVYVSGVLHDNSVTPGGTVISSAHDNFLLSKLNKATGAEMWLKEFDSNFDHDDYFVGIDADGYGNIYAAGRLRGTSVSLGSEINHTGGAAHSELMIAHFLSDGAFQSFEVIPSSNGSWGMSIATYKNEKYVVGGYYNNTITFGTIVPNMAFDNAFIATRDLGDPIKYTSASGNGVFCQSETDPIPTSNLPTGGTFSGPTGIDFEDASTGEVNLGNSTPGGPYTIAYTGFASYCTTVTAEFQLSIVAEDDASFDYATDHFCKNEPNPSPTVYGTTGGTFSTTAGLSINGATGEIDVTASTAGGPYTITYTTNGTCPDSETFDVYIENSPDPNFGYSNSTYCGGSGTISPTFAVTPNGTFSAPAGVVISSASGDIDLNTSTPGGPYTIQYLASNSYCQDSATFDITILQPEDGSFTYASNYLCVNGPNVLPSSVATSPGVFSTTSPLIITNASTGEIGASASPVGGPYRIYYTTSVGTCPGTDSLDIYIEPGPDPSFSYAQSVYCFGPDTILPSSIAQPGGTFSSQPGLAIIDPTTGEIDISASTVGTTFVIKYVVSNAYCSDSSTFNMIILPNEDASFSYSGAHFCNNEANPTPTISGTAGGTFSGPTGLIVDGSSGEIDVAASIVGSYYVVYTTNGANCPTSDSVQVYIEAAPDATFNYAPSFCTGDGLVSPSITTPGGTFLWPVGIAVVVSGTGQINIDASNVGGPYSIQYDVTNTYCQANSSDSFTIYQSEDASFAYSGAHFCENEANPTPTISGTSGGTFSGPTGLVVDGTSGEIDVVASTLGSYYVVYTTNGVNCPASDSVQVYIEAAPDATFNYAPSYCIGDGLVSPSITTSGGTFFWPVGIAVVTSSIGEIDIDLSAVGGPYTIQYDVSNTYCQASSFDDFVIYQSEDASFSYSGVHFCNNESNPTPTVSGTPGGTFSASAGLVVDGTSGEIDVVASSVGGPYTIVYTTNGAVCPSSDSTQVYIEDSPDPSFAYGQTAYCTDVDNVFPSSTAVQSGVFSSQAGLVLINPGTGELDISASSPGGPYNVQYLVANTYCEDSTTFGITVNASEDASFSYSGTHFCRNESNPVPNPLVTPGGMFTAQTGLVIDGSSGEIDVVASTAGGPYTIVYTTNGATCPSSDSIEVYIENAPDPSFSYSSIEYCSTEGIIEPISIAVTGGVFSGPTEINFTNIGTGEIDISNSDSGGPYTIQYLVSNTYCQKSTTFDMTIIEQDDLSSVEYLANEFCVTVGNQLPTITGLDQGTFSGPTSIDFINTTSGEFSPSTSDPGGPYLVKYVTPGACPDSIEFPLTIFDVPTAYAGEDQELYFTFSSSLEADIPLVGNGIWSTIPSSVVADEFDPNTDIEKLELGTNTFVWTVTNGVCPKAEDEIVIEVLDLYIPQALTPNDDGKNDFFELRSIDEVTCALQIFNRWGQVVYETNEYQNEWYGQNMSGKQLENDTYFYVILIDDSISYNGYIVLKK